MNRQQFMKQFINALEPLSPEERQQVSEYYEELICDGLEEGLTEEEILARFGSPEEEAARFLEENPSSISKQEPFVFCPSGKTSVLDLSAKDVSVRLLPFDGEQLQIRFEYDAERAKVESWQDGSTWFFRHTPPRKRFRDLFGLGTRRGEITVFVPKTFYGSLLIKTQNAKITGEQLPPLMQISAVSSNATIQLDSLSAESLTVRTSNSAIRLTDCGGETLEAHTSNGSLRAQRVAYRKQMWETSNGSIRFHEISGLGLSAATSNSSVAISDCSAGELTISTSNGSISVDSITGDTLRFTTSNASITGSLHGNPADYQVWAHTSNGSCNLTNVSDANRPKQLSAQTSNGKISIAFL